jgi:hypothetical protein
VAQIAKPFFNFRTEGCEVNLVRRETDHKRPLGASEFSVTMSVDALLTRATAAWISAADPRKISSQKSL